MLRKIIIFMVLSILISLSLFAGTTGRLAGKITDEKGKPISYATIIIQGEGYNGGTQSDEKGAYIIINIPPGEYIVMYQQLSFQPKKFTGVVINLDETTIKNVSLTTSAIEMQEFVVIESEVELVSASKTGSGNTITSAALEDLTVDDIDEIVALQAGASMVNGELHVRGGRANEVSYSVDGMSVSDPVDGGASLTIDSDAIYQTKVMTGGFSAEYGNAQSGIINIVTKSGSENYSGKLEFKTDHLFEGDHSNSDIVKFAIGGPLLTPAVSKLRDKLTFFLNGSANWYDTRYKDYYISDPVTDLKYLSNTHYSTRDPYENRENIIGFDFGSNRNFNDYNLNFKTKYKISNTQSFTLAVRGDQYVRDPYSHFWKFALEHFFRYESSQQQYIFTYDKTIGSNINIKVKGSVYGKQFKQYPKGIARSKYFTMKEEWETIDYANLSYGDSLRIIQDDPVDYFTHDGVVGPERDFEWNFFDTENNPITNFAQPGTIAGTYINDENKIYTLKTDFEYMYNTIHNFKTGFEVMKHYIRKDQLFNPWVVDAHRYDTYLKGVTPILFFQGPDSTGFNADIFYLRNSDGEIIDSLEFQTDTSFYSGEDRYNATLVASGETDGYEANPWQGAFYLQDSMQWEGMIVNAGLRFDFWFLGNEYKKFQNDGSFENIEFNKDDKFQIMLSPRLGISHPISETSVLHFAYNYQNQLPQMQFIFTSKSPTDAATGSQNIVIGNATLEPQITVTYEVGLQKALSDIYVLDISAYYKNIYNYVNTQKVFLQTDGSLIPYNEDPDDKSIPMYRYISEDYGSVRGLDINLQRELANFISSNVSYSLSWAQGNNSGAVFQDEATSLREFPLDWDLRNSANFNIVFKVGKGEDWYIPVTDLRFPIDNFSISFNYDINSGKPYTPLDFHNNPLDTNSEHQKYTENSSLKINKVISFGGNTSLKLYTQISNLFNRKNINNVYPKTGSPYYDGADLSTSTGYVSEEAVHIHELGTRNPSMLSAGRVISVGASINW